MGEDLFGLVGTTLDGKYRVDAQVGEGGFGVVYRGFHLSFEQPVAIKCLKVPAHFTSEAKQLFMDKFREEGKLLAKLRHPAIVRVFDFGVVPESNLPFLVLEWMDGRDLEEALTDRAEPFSETEAIRFLRPAVDAIALAHRRGVAHRDIKPANLFLADTEDGTKLMVLDFGIAKAMQEGETATQRQTKTSSGFSAFSPGYGAPEQFHSKKYGPTGPWTDVHALGLILVELLAGRPALEGEEMADFLLACVRQDRPTPRALGLDVSDAFETICGQALALMPGDRFSSAEDLLLALEGLTDAAASDSHSAAVAAEEPSARTESHEADGVPEPRQAEEDVDTAAFLAARPEDAAPLVAPTVRQVPIPSTVPQKPAPTGKRRRKTKRRKAGQAFETGGQQPSKGDTEIARTPTVSAEPGAKARGGLPVTTKVGIAAALLLIGTVGLCVAPGSSESPDDPGATSTETVSSPIATFTPSESTQPVPRPKTVRARRPATKPAPRPKPAPPPPSPRLSPMVLVPSGKFRMGCAPDDEACDTRQEPRRLVDLDAFFIDVTEVTVTHYRWCVAVGDCDNAHLTEQSNDGREFKEDKFCNWDTVGRANHPINCVGWSQADAFCKWAGKRLPTEEEWEKAARGTDGRIYPWGKKPPSCQLAVVKDDDYGCGRRSTWPAGSKPAGKSPYGVMNMGGNVGEWVSDRSVRGGAWLYPKAAWLRVSHRAGKFPGRGSFIGFRCARSAQGASQALKAACARGEMSACTNLGEMYADGQGVAENDSAAVPLLRRACDGGHMRGCARLGAIYAETNGAYADPKGAIRLLSKGCDAEEAAACSQLAFLYLTGQGVPANKAEAIVLLQKACDAGKADTCSMLGRFYEVGMHVAKDPKQAASLYRKACDGMDRQACDQLK
jgi:serine/threonine-protein kinase